MSVETAKERRLFKSKVGDLSFTMDVPAGFFESPVPEVKVDFDDYAQAAPLALLASPVMDGMIVVAARPAYSSGSVLQWVRYLAGEFGLDLQHTQAHEGGEDGSHAMITSFGAKKQDGKKHSLMLVAFEDGGWMVTAHASCPAANWNEWGNALAGAVESIRLTKPKGSRVDLDTLTAEGWGRVERSAEDVREERERWEREQEARRGPAVAQAEALMAEDRYGEAELTVQRVDSSIYGGVAIARLYESRLKALVAAGGFKRAGRERERVEEVYRRALGWAQGCYPEAHTEVEAEDYERGREEDRARLVKVLGYDPDGGAR